MRPVVRAAGRRGAGTVALVGAGPGDPGLMTVRGLELLRRAHVVVYDRLVDPCLLDAAPRARRIFAGKASDHHTLPQERINALLIMHARRGRRVVRLKGGDPFVFGRGGEEADALARAGIPFEVVPGGSSVRILGVWIDPKLHWGEHVRAVAQKMQTQTNALLRTTASTRATTYATGTVPPRLTCGPGRSAWPW